MVRLGGHAVGLVDSAGATAALRLGQPWASVDPGAPQLQVDRWQCKLNDPLYYYWADRLGVLILSDLPCTDLDAPSARRHWEAGLRGAIERDFNHPSVIGWVLFNETWGLDNHDRPDGQAWVRSMFDLAKRLDLTRLVEDNSPCLYDHVVTDLNSWHFYVNDYDQTRRHVDRIVPRPIPVRASTTLARPFRAPRR
jgi:hypothetical protein